MAEGKQVDLSDFDLSPIITRLVVCETTTSKFEENLKLLKTDEDTTRTRVTNLLQRTEPRIVLIEEVLIKAGLLMYDQSGAIVKSPIVDLQKRGPVKRTKVPEKKIIAR